jgi:hypothetical protein
MFYTAQTNCKLLSNISSCTYFHDLKLSGSSVTHTSDVRGTSSRWYYWSYEIGVAPSDITFMTNFAKIIQTHTTGVPRKSALPSLRNESRLKASHIIKHIRNPLIIFTEGSLKKPPHVITRNSPNELRGNVVGIFIVKYKLKLKLRTKSLKIAPCCYTVRCQIRFTSRLTVGA